VPVPDPPTARAPVSSRPIAAARARVGAPRRLPVDVRGRAAALTFPAKASGYQGVKEKMKLRIISTPGDDGTLRVRSHPENAESNPANDEVKLVVTVGGSGGGLPVTGANAALVGGIGGGVVAIGAALFFFAKRRRVVVVSE
jgi:LPXTG-motif cell wall-anchored protein